MHRSVGRFFTILGALIFGGATVSCGAGESAEPSLSGHTPFVSEGANLAPEPLTDRVAGDRYEDDDCDAPVPIYRDGAVVGRTCESRAQARGLTVLELSDGFAPGVFSENLEAEVGQQPYRAAYLALADERLRQLPRHIAREKYLELYGIFPTFRVLQERLTDAERHACHAEIDDTPFESLPDTIRPWSADQSSQRRRARGLRYLESRLERAKQSRGLTSIDELADDRQYGRMYERFVEDRAVVNVITATQKHLVCDGLLRRRYSEGVFDWPTIGALRDYQQMTVVVSPGHIDGPTGEAMSLSSSESDFRAVLRTLRERVVSATGLLEDGTARQEFGTILGRAIDPPQFQADAGRSPLDNGAPDLVSAATEAAARALGWTAPESFVSFYEALGDEGTTQLRVAVRLPALPGYHGAHMELRAEIDRGDVWYEYPYTGRGGHRGHQLEQRPTLTLYVSDGDSEIALVRWPTTIGGWKPESLPDGGVGLRYKESPPGERIWRDVIASPAWLPPPGTPDDELVRGPQGGPYRGRFELFGPSYRSAYGLTMVMHHKVIEPDEEGEEPRYVDEGIRAHGSVSYNSILRGTSHGCHRLYNHLAVRLSSFLLAHRNHERRGYMPARYLRTVTMERTEEGEPLDPQEIEIRLRTRGYRFELTPPVRVEVLEGRIRGHRQEPSLGFRRLRQELVADAVAQAAEDG